MRAVGDDRAASGETADGNDDDTAGPGPGVQQRQWRTGQRAYPGGVSYGSDGVKVVTTASLSGGYWWEGWRPTV